MSAIEHCRTAELGGHVARCADCAYTTIAYNSCRNRHCPKCQGAAAKDWLADREADLLPVPYYHVVFTLPAAIADIAYQNIARARVLLAVAKPEEDRPTGAADDPSKPACPCCDGRMIIIEVFARGATPRHRPTAPANAIRIDTS